MPSLMSQYNLSVGLEIYFLNGTFLWSLKIRRFGLIYSVCTGKANGQTFHEYYLTGERLSLPNKMIATDFLSLLL